MEGHTVTIDMVRVALRSFGANSQEISNAQLYHALGLESEPEKARLRFRINDMVQHGEVSKVRAGVYTYNFKHRPRDSKAYPAIWRFVRKSKPGWSVSECALMTRVGYTHVLRYCSWLEDEGFVECIGKNDRNARQYAGTSKADMAPETPYPPFRETDPFEREKGAATAVVRLMMCADPYAPKTARGIVDACNTLLARFSKPVIETENVQNQGDSHAE